MKPPGEPPLSWSNFSLRQDCYIGWNPPQGRSRGGRRSKPDIPGQSKESIGGHEQGIIRDERGQVQPTDKERARRVSKVDRAAIYRAKGLSSRPAPANVRCLHGARGGNSPLHAGAMGHGAPDALISVRLAIAESRCKPWPYPVEKRFHGRFSGRGSYGILRPLQRSGPVAWPPAGLCRASPERA